MVSLTDCCLYEESMMVSWNGPCLGRVAYPVTLCNQPSMISRMKSSLITGWESSQGSIHQRISSLSSRKYIPKRSAMCLLYFLLKKSGASFKNARHSPPTSPSYE